MAAGLIHRDYQNIFRFDEFILWLNSSYYNGPGITSGGSQNCWKPYLANSLLWPAQLQPLMALCSSKMTEKNIFPSTDFVSLAALAHLHVYKRQGTSLKEGNPVPSWQKPKHPTASLAGYCLCYISATSPLGLKTGKSEEWTAPVISFITEVVTGGTGLRLPPGFFHLHKCIPTVRANNGSFSCISYFSSWSTGYINSAKRSLVEGVYSTWGTAKEKQLFQQGNLALWLIFWLF